MKRIEFEDKGQRYFLFRVSFNEHGTIAPAAENATPEDLRSAGYVPEEDLKAALNELHQLRTAVLAAMTPMTEPTFSRTSRFEDQMDLVICRTYGCQNLKHRCAVFCGPCGEDYRSDPEAYK